MKEYTSDKIRNVAVLSHDGAGKTAVVESLLLACGAVDAVGVGDPRVRVGDREEVERDGDTRSWKSYAYCCCKWQLYRYGYKYRWLRGDFTRSSNI